MSQRTIILYSAATDKAGKRREAGERLVVGDVDRDEVDISPADADDLVERRMAASPSLARQHERTAAEMAGKPAPVDPLDHDGDGAKGGSLPNMPTA